MRRVTLAQIIAFCVFAAFLAACGSEQSRTPVIGQAFAGPSNLTLRQELTRKSPVTATVHHGERLDVLEYKRRFVKVRTAGGIVGWTNTAQLMTPDQMAQLRQMAGRAAQLPSQGTATTFETVNIHTDTNRASPSFLQLPENAKVEVVGHKIAPRTQAEPAAPERAQKPRKKRKSKQKSSKILLIPPPPAPAIPANWLELSKSSLPGDNAAALAAKPAPPPPPAHMEDWSLIRIKDGQAGWVLSRMLSMSIPDEVAQYAEGHRITSYFPMGDVQDGDQVKHNWLWTTMTKKAEPYEFDRFRFFIWNPRRHRYETAFIARDVVGHYPVTVNTAGADPSFTVILEDDGGNLVQKTYAFNGYRVHLVDSAPYRQTEDHTAPPGMPVARNKPAQSSQTWYAGVKRKLANLLRL